VSYLTRLKSLSKYGDLKGRKLASYRTMKRRLNPLGVASIFFLFSIPSFGEEPKSKIRVEAKAGTAVATQHAENATSHETAATLRGGAAVESKYVDADGSIGAAVKKNGPTQLVGDYDLTAKIPVGKKLQLTGGLVGEEDLNLGYHLAKAGVRVPLGTRTAIDLHGQGGIVTEVGSDRWGFEGGVGFKLNADVAKVLDFYLKGDAGILIGMGVANDPKFKNNQIFLGQDEFGSFIASKAGAQLNLTESLQLVCEGGLKRISYSEEVVSSDSTQGQDARSRLGVTATAGVAGTF
jgi:hypothetical protein